MLDLDGEPDLVHLGRQFRQGLVAAGQKLHLADVLIRAHLESDGDGRIPVVGAGGRHVDHARRSVDLFFQGGGHRAGQNHNQRDGHGKNGTLNEKIHRDFIPFIM